MAKEHVRTWGAFVGFFTWYQVMFYDFSKSPLRILTEANIGASPLALQMMFHFGMGIAAILSFFLLRDSICKGPRLFWAMLYGLAFIALLMLPLLENQVLFHGMVCLCGLLIGAIFYRTLLACFAFLPRLSLIRLSVLVFAVAYGSFSLLSVLSKGLRPWVLYAIAMGFFLVSAVFGLFNRDGAMPVRKDLPDRHFSFPFMSPMILLIVGMGICFSAYKVLVLPEMPETGFSLFYPILPMGIALALIYRFGEKLQPGTFMRLTLALITAAFIAFQVLGAKGRIVVVTMMQPAYLCCSVMGIVYYYNLYWRQSKQSMRFHVALLVLFLSLALCESIGLFVFQAFLRGNLARFGWIYAILAGLLLLIPRNSAVLEDFDGTDFYTIKGGTALFLPESSDEKAFRAGLRVENALGLLTPPEKLTPREVEVLKQLLEKRDADAIAYQLGISLNTVRTHIKHICEKFGVKSKVELLNLTGTFSVLDRLSARELEVLVLAAGENDDNKIAKTLFISTSTVRTHIHNIARKYGVESRKELILRYRGMVSSSSDTQPLESVKRVGLDSLIPDSFAHCEQNPKSIAKS